MDYLRFPYSNDPYMSHWGFQKANHKYTAREWVNGKWNYIYGNAKAGAKAVAGGASKAYDSASKFVDKNITGASAKAKAQKFAGSKSTIGKFQESQATKSYNNSAAGRISSASKWGSTKISELKTSGASAISSGKKAIGKLGRNASTKMGELKTAAGSQIDAGKKKLMKTFRPAEYRDMVRKNSWSQRADVNLRKAGEAERNGDWLKGARILEASRRKANALPYSRVINYDPYDQGRYGMGDERPAYATSAKDKQRAANSVHNTNKRNTANRSYANASARNANDVYQNPGTSRTGYSNAYATRQAATNRANKESQVRNTYATNQAYRNDPMRLMTKKPKRPGSTWKAYTNKR